MCGLVVTGCGGETVAADSDAVSRGSGVVTVGLITKTDQNPFFVAMADGAAQRAAELGVELHTFAGAFDGDWETQAAAVDELVALGAHGILITPSDPAALAPVIERARGRGVLVISLDPPSEDPETVDGTFATDNFAAGELIARWAHARMAVADTDAGPRFEAQVLELRAIIQRSAVPVPLIIDSDNETEIRIPKVSIIGTFLRNELMLRPGRYVIVGSRDLPLDPDVPVVVKEE